MPSFSHTGLHSEGKVRLQNFQKGDGLLYLQCVWGQVLVQGVKSLPALKCIPVINKIQLHFLWDEKIYVERQGQITLTSSLDVFPGNTWQQPRHTWQRLAQQRRNFQPVRHSPLLARLPGESDRCLTKGSGPIWCQPTPATCALPWKQGQQQQS